jgi:hypothetical protein
MLQAWIVSPRESLYFAAEATPCNLAALHRHVRRMQRHLRGRLHLSLNPGGPDVGAGAAGISAFLQRLASEGVDVTLSGAIESSGAHRSPDAGSLAHRLAGARSDEHRDRSSAPPTTSAESRAPSPP